MAGVVMPTGGKKQAEEAQILSTAGTVAGSMFGGPVGGAIGGMAGGALAAKPAQQPQSAMERRASDLQNQAAIGAANEAVQTLPADQQAQYAPVLNQAMARAQKRQGVTQWRE